jgi:DNA-binding XRE family transcriptional regulator
MGNERVLYELIKSGEWKINQMGHVLAKRKGKWKRIEHKTPQGYLQVRKMLKRVRLHTGVHRLVYHHFKGAIPAGMTINHINGRKDDNRPENLELATYSENMKHAFLIGLINQDGQRNPASKLTDQQVTEIRERYAQGNITQDALGKEYGVTFQTISRIVRGDRRKNQEGPVADYTHRRTSRERQRNHKGQFLS